MDTTLAIATGILPDGAPEDDRLLRTGLLARGADTPVRTWSDPGAAWSRFDAVRTLGMGGTTYARVDGVVIDDRFLLMELESIEPNLFLSMAGVVDAFADEVATTPPGILAV